MASASAAIQIVSARTGDTGNGYLDHINVTFNVPMDKSSTILRSSGPGDPGFWVDGYEIDTAVGSGGFAWADDAGLTLRVHLVEGTTFDTDATPTVHYEASGGLSDAVGDDEPDTTQEDSVDGAGPVLVGLSIKDLSSQLVFNTLGEEARLHFSEPAALTGLTPEDRWNNLEESFKYAGTICTDGQGHGGSAWNFPQPGTGADPIIAPVNATALVDTFIVRYEAGNKKSTDNARMFGVADPRCYAQIDTASGANLVIRDAIGNAAMATAAQRVQAQPLDAAIASAATADGVAATTDGKVDAIKLTFDTKIEDATFAAHLDRFAVSLDGNPAAIDPMLYTGATADDEIVYLGIPEAAWSGGVLPSVGYAKPEECTSTAGTPGVKAIVPAGGTWRACLGGFTRNVVDGVLPRIVSAATGDVDGDGLLDRITLTMSEPVSTPTTTGWQVDGATAAAAVDPADATKVHLTFGEGTVGNTGALPAYSYTAQAPGGGAGTVDAGANQPLAGTFAAGLDRAAPRIFEASIVDADDDGDVDTVELLYSEPVADPAAGFADGFTVGGSNGTGATRVATDTLAVTFAPVNGTDAKAIEYAPAGAVADAAGNNATAQSIAASDVVDLAQPVAAITVSPSAPLSTGMSTVTAAYSEQMLTSVAPAATLGSLTVTPVSDANHTNGWRNDDATTWDGTVEIFENDCGVATGCAVNVTVDQAGDLASPANAQHAATLPTEIDTKAPLAPSASSIETTVAAGEAAPAGTVNMFTRSITLNGAVAADAGSGTAEIVVDGTQELGLDDEIAESDVTVTPVIDFADADAVRAALSDGPHTLAVKVCDDALNCTVSADSLPITVDATPVAISLGAPNGGDIVAGGSSLDITWDAGDDADFDHVELDYSTDGGDTFTNVIDHARTERDGTFSWTTPSVDEAAVKVRAVAFDGSLNKTAAASTDVFAIDTNAPVVNLSGLASFLPAGQDVTLEWTATDATIDRVESPITIEYSANNGTDWAPINGGTYSGANDGEEVWHVPAGPDFDLKVRVTAADAVAKTTTATSGRLVGGVAGYVSTHAGKVYAFGTAERTTNESVSVSSDWVRGMAMRSAGTSGYLLSKSGRLYPFSTGDADMPARPKTVPFSTDAARGVALRSDASGYVLSKSGRLYSFGGAPKARVSKTWSCDCAEGVTMLANKRGGYVLDSYGRLHPFAVGSYSLPRQIQSRVIWSDRRAVGFVLRSDERTGYLLRNDGNVISFGGIPSVSESGDGSSVTAAAIVKITDSAGYWIDNRGNVHRWGAGYGSPTVTPFRSSYARGAAAI